MRCLTRSDIERLLDQQACIDAVEGAFRALGTGRSSHALLAVHSGTGGFHAKAALLAAERCYFATKINSNFPENPTRKGLPTIQGVVVLFDGETGVPLALMDSMAITILRTAAATAVAARYLARADAESVGIIGCGAQALAQLAALTLVRHVTTVRVFDINPGAAQRFVDQARSQLGLDVDIGNDVAAVTRSSAIVVTCTPSRRAFIDRAALSDGAFIAAVGADNEHKQEIDPSLLASSAVVCDSIAQCATIGDLHHAIESGVMQRGDVRAELADVLIDPSRGRRADDDIVIFDSTGIAI